MINYKKNIIYKKYIYKLYLIIILITVIFLKINYQKIQKNIIISLLKIINKNNNTKIHIKKIYYDNLGYININNIKINNITNTFFINIDKIKIKFNFYYLFNNNWRIKNIIINNAKTYIHYNTKDNKFYNSWNNIFKKNIFIDNIFIKNNIINITYKHNKNININAKYFNLEKIKIKKKIYIEKIDTLFNVKTNHLKKNKIHIILKNNIIQKKLFILNNVYLKIHKNTLTSKIIFNLKNNIIDINVYNNNIINKINIYVLNNKKIYFNIISGKIKIINFNIIKLSNLLINIQHTYINIKNIYIKNLYNYKNIYLIIKKIIITTDTKNIFKFFKINYTNKLYNIKKKKYKFFIEKIIYKNSSLIFNNINNKIHHISIIKKIFKKNIFKGIVSINKKNKNININYKYIINLTIKKKYISIKLIIRKILSTNKIILNEIYINGKYKKNNLLINIFTSKKSMCTINYVFNKTCDKLLLFYKNNIHDILNIELKFFRKNYIIYFDKFIYNIYQKIYFNDQILKKFINYKNVFLVNKTLKNLNIFSNKKNNLLIYIKKLNINTLNNKIILDDSITILNNKHNLNIKNITKNIIFNNYIYQNIELLYNKFFIKIKTDSITINKFLLKKNIFLIKNIKKNKKYLIQIYCKNQLNCYNKIFNIVFKCNIFNSENRYNIFLKKFIINKFIVYKNLYIQNIFNNKFNILNLFNIKLNKNQTNLKKSIFFLYKIFNNYNHLISKYIFNIKIKYNLKRDKLNFNFTYNKKKIFKIKYKCNIIKIYFYNINIYYLNDFLNEQKIIKKLQGYVNGYIQIYIKNNKIYYQGKILLNKIYFQIKPCNIRYKLLDNSEIIIINKKLLIKNIIIEDVLYHTRAKLLGYMYYKKYNDYLITLKIQTSNLLLFNNYYSTKSIFFGKIFVKSIIEIILNQDTINVNIIEGEINKLSKIFINSYNLSKINNKRNTNNKYKFKKKINIQIDISNNVNIYIFLNKKIYVLLQGRGTFNYIKQNNKINLYGYFNVNKGICRIKKYKDMIFKLDKKFFINKNSKTIWSGNPHNPFMSIKISCTKNIYNAQKLIKTKYILNKPLKLRLNIYIKGKLKSPNYHVRFKALNYNNHISHIINKKIKKNITKNLEYIFIFNKLYSN